MRISVRSSSGVSPSLSAFAKYRFQFALGRFGSRVRSLTIRLLDLNGPKGGVDKQCLVAVRLHRPTRLIVIDDVDTDAAAAIHRAADRAARAVARAVDALTDHRVR